MRNKIETKIETILTDALLLHEMFNDLSSELDFSSELVLPTVHQDEVGVVGVQRGATLHVIGAGFGRVLP